jgi:thiamine-phosphate pyrophosphorylase
VFKVNKSKKFLGVNKFNFMTLNKKAYFVALGGINERNYKMIKLLRTSGFASIGWAKKNGLRKLRPF